MPTPEELVEWSSADGWWERMEYDCKFAENCSWGREPATVHVYADLKKPVATGRYPVAGISSVEVAGLGNNA